MLEFRHQPDKVIWLDVLDPTEADLALLRAEFDFHPLALEDCAKAHSRPKLEKYPGYLFFVVYEVAAEPLSRVLRHTRVLTGKIVSIDHASRLAVFAPARGPERMLRYDVLVMAAGSVSRVLPVEGLAEYGAGFKTAGEAGFWAMMVFIAELLIGYVYVWRRGALEWD